MASKSSGHRVVQPAACTKRRCRAAASCVQLCVTWLYMLSEAWLIRFSLHSLQQFEGRQDQVWTRLWHLCLLHELAAELAAARHAADLVLVW